MICRFGIWAFAQNPSSMLVSDCLRRSEASELIMFHTVPYITFAAEIQDMMVLETLLVHPLATFSAVKKLLEPSTTKADIDLSKYRFSRDGREAILDSRRLWDMDIVSGAVIYLRK
jgi:hypothetical protein